MVSDPVSVLVSSPGVTVFLALFALFAAVNPVLQFFAHRREEKRREREVRAWERIAAVLERLP